jgi:hypothetical protein
MVLLCRPYRGSLSLAQATRQLIPNFAGINTEFLHDGAAAARTPSATATRCRSSFGTPGRSF